MRAAAYVLHVGMCTLMAESCDAWIAFLMDHPVLPAF